MSGRTTVRRKRFTLFMLGFTALCGLVLLGLGLWASRNGIDRMNDAIEAATPYLTAWRALVYGALVGGWPWWVRRVARRYHWTDSRRIRVAGQRWNAALILVLLELVFVQDLPDRLYVLSDGL